MKEDKVRMLTPPMCFWDKITNQQWKSMSDEEQDKLVNAAKVLLNVKDDEER